MSEQNSKAVNSIISIVRLRAKILAAMSLLVLIAAYNSYVGGMSHDTFKMLSVTFLGSTHLNTALLIFLNIAVVIGLYGFEKSIMNPSLFKSYLLNLGILMCLLHITIHVSCFALNYL